MLLKANKLRFNTQLRRIQRHIQPRYVLACKRALSSNNAVASGTPSSNSRTIASDRDNYNSGGGGMLCLINEGEGPSGQVGCLLLSSQHYTFFGISTISYCDMNGTQLTESAHLLFHQARTRL